MGFFSIASNNSSSFLPLNGVSPVKNPYVRIPNAQ
jgi:hypothetical protein